jgi:glycine/D-amino acid oxidase-like deaminating enzyme
MNISLWWDTLPAELKEPLGSQLPGNRDADVAIVGAGFTGLWTAYYLKLASPDMRIALVDAHVAGFGASGRNGGWASALFPASLDALARASSRQDAIRMKRTMCDTVQEIARVSSEWDVDWAAGGTVTLARTPLQLERAQQEIQDLRSWGFSESDYALLTQEETHQITSATDVLGATFTPHCAAMNPAKLVRRLAREVRNMGVEFYENTPAVAVEPGTVRTEHGLLRAPIIVRATEGYTTSLRGQRRTLAPVYSLMLATEPLDATALAEIGFADRQTFSDGRHLIIYGQRTADGRIAFGGRGAPYHFGSAIDASFDQDGAVHANLWTTLCELFPVLRSAKVTHTWGGPLGIARDWWASVGLDRETGLAWAGGYVGDGVGTSNLAGRTLSDLILRQSSDLVTLPWVNHRSPRWEPEPLRWAGTNMALRLMVGADDKELRTGKPSRAAAFVNRQLGH